MAMSSRSSRPLRADDELTQPLGDNDGRLLCPRIGRRIQRSGGVAQSVNCFISSLI
jgi:hypothetical protein